MCDGGSTGILRLGVPKPIFPDASGDQDMRETDAATERLCLACGPLAIRRTEGSAARGLFDEGVYQPQLCEACESNGTYKRTNFGHPRQEKEANVSEQ
jgi:hypothetical protein